MRFLYVAPRYHTNQMDIMKGLTEQGHEVKFAVAYKALIEDYSVVEPVLLGYSPLYRVIDYIYVHIIHRKDPEAIVYKIAHGFPPVHRLKKLIREYRPDVTIVREKSVYSMVTYMICKRYKLKCILYNQNPYYIRREDAEHIDFAHRCVNKFLPEMRMTPVLGNPEGKIALDTDRYIPFVMDPQSAPGEREYFKGNRINILCIGKYEIRKHHLELLEVVRQLYDAGITGVKVTLIGEATNDFQKGYHAKVVDYVKEHEMADYVEVLTNVPRNEMGDKYLEADIYVLPSTGESASVSQLEAMSYSLPVICSDTNGTACYVESGVTGYLFRDKNMEDLKTKLKTLLENRELILEMGAAGYRDILEKYNFEQYFESIMGMLEK